MNHATGDKHFFILPQLGTGYCQTVDWLLASGIRQM
jgi:hypothetical protein